MAANRIRVLIVDDHRMVADGLALTLSHDPEITVVGVGTTMAEGVALALEHRPNVVLMDYFLPDGTGARAATQIREHAPDAAVVILTASGDDDALLAAVDSGACGFLLKTQAAIQVVEAVRRAAEGEMLIPAATLVGLLSRSRQRESSDGRIRHGETLTAREHEILSMVARGASNRAIAEELVIEYSTVRSHVQKIIDKLGAHSKLEAVARASEAGLLDR
jgi:two-component system, NarL family, response regulator DevR